MVEGPDVSHPERQIAIAHAPRLARESLATLFAIDERLSGIVARAKEPTIALMRLVWWRDALAALDSERPPAEPLLAAASGLRPDRISGAELAAMAEGWEALLDDPDLSDETVRHHARERGGRLFLLAGRVLGYEADRLAEAGEGWALADLARHGAPTARADALLDMARPVLDRAVAARWPHRLRPLGMLTVLARQDARRGFEALHPPASRRRLMRLLVHRWTGR